MRCQSSRDRPVYIWLKNAQSCLLCDEPSDNPQALIYGPGAPLPGPGEAGFVAPVPAVAPAKP